MEFLIMHVMSRLSVCAFAGALAIAGITLSELEYRQVDPSASAQETETPEMERSRDLDAKLVIVKQILHREQELAKEVIAGRIDLQTAGREYVEVEQHMPGRDPRFLRACCPNQTDLERCARQLMEPALEGTSQSHEEAQLRTQLKLEFEELVLKEHYLGQN
jgi:hypothetical protein